MGYYDHPPYSPDLEPCDYHLYEPLNEHPAAMRYGKDAYVKQAVTSWLLAYRYLTPISSPPG
jgi:hypothetical protein